MGEERGDREEASGQGEVDRRTVVMDRWGLQHPQSSSVFWSVLHRSTCAAARARPPQANGPPACPPQSRR